MSDVIFVYKKGSHFKVLNLDKSVHAKELTSNGWVHIESLSASVWMERLLNMSREDRFWAISEITNKAKGA